jgi:hypothetical protein
LKLVDILDKYGMKLYTFFTFAEYNNKEGLLFFDLIFKKKKNDDEIKYEFEDKEVEIDSEEYKKLISDENTKNDVAHYIEPKFLLIDGEDYKIDDTMLTGINILVDNPNSKEIPLLFLNGDETMLSLNDMAEFPFKLKKMEHHKQLNIIKDNFVEIKK